jgi:hypothetical protein
LKSESPPADEQVQEPLWVEVSSLPEQCVPLHVFELPSAQLIV